MNAPGYEARDVSVSAVVRTIAGVAVGVAICLGVGVWLCRELPRETDATRSFRHGPSYRSSIARDWEKQDAAVRQHLEGYDWVDRQAGLVRIPVERAMELELATPHPETIK